MKKILTPGVLIHEEVEYFCDKHPERKAYSRVEVSSWYGSGFDLMKVEAHLCDECVSSMHSLLKKQFGVDPVEIEI
jgi:hypothetical protein